MPLASAIVGVKYKITLQTKIVLNEIYKTRLIKIYTKYEH